MTTYGERLRAARTARGWSQREVAKRAGCSDGFVSQVETGHAATLGLDIARRIADVLGLDIDLHAPAAPRTVMARIGRQWCKQQQPDRLRELVDQALRIDGAHHKQWYLAQMADLLGVAVDGDDRGIAP